MNAQNLSSEENDIDTDSYNTKIIIFSSQFLFVLNRKIDKVRQTFLNNPIFTKGCILLYPVGGIIANGSKYRYNSVKFTTLLVWSNVWGLSLIPGLVMNSSVNWIENSDLLFSWTPDNRRISSCWWKIIPRSVLFFKLLTLHDRHNDTAQEILTPNTDKESVATVCVTFIVMLAKWHLFFNENVVYIFCWSLTKFRWYYSAILSRWKF